MKEVFRGLLYGCLGTLLAGLIIFCVNAGNRYDVETSAAYAARGMAAAGFLVLGRLARDLWVFGRTGKTS